MANAIQGFNEQKFESIEKKMEQAGFSVERIKQELSFAMQIINKSSQLPKCTGESILEAVANISLIGLSLNPAAKEAYLLPRWNSKAGVMEACLEPGYVGLVKLLTDAGSVTAMACQLVYENDDFSLDLANNQTPVIHKLDPKVKRGAILGAYALGTLSSGDRQVEYMTLDQIEEIRGRSENWKAFKNGKISASTWGTDFGEMARKTVIRRIYKFLPRTDRMAKLDAAVQLDNSDYAKFIEEAVTKAISFEKGKPAQDELPEALLGVIALTDEKEKLREIYSANPELHSNPKFMQALTDRKKEINKSLNPA